MAWISVHESIDGPKLRNLYKQLGCSKFEATGILNFLWFWGLTNAERDGLILYAEKEDIERYLYGVGAGCVLDPKKIVDALFDSGWLDWSPRGICIHDWETWQAQWQKAKDARERDAARKRESRRNSKAAAQNEEKADAAKDGHTDGPADGEEKQLKIDGGETPAAEKAPAEPPEPPKPPAEPATPKYENLVRLEYRRQCNDFKFPKDTPLDVRITAYYGIPKSASKKKAQLMRERKIRPMKKPDFDNIGKIVCDSLNDIAYHDDAQIVDAQVRKFFSDDPRVVVTIQEAE